MPMEANFQVSEGMSFHFLRTVAGFLAGRSLVSVIAMILFQNIIKA